MQHGGRDDVIRTPGSLHVGGYVERMDQKGRAIRRTTLAAMLLLGKLDRPPRRGRPARSGRARPRTRPTLTAALEVAHPG
jgi:hypothetical protein